MVLSVGCLSILEIDLHFPPPVRLSDLCTLWCHGEYCVRLLFELKGKWCFDNLYISNWKVEINNFWLLRLLTGFWLRARWLDSVPSYLIHLYHPRVTFHHVVIFKSKSKLYTSYIHFPNDKLKLFWCLDYHVHIPVQDFGDFDKRLSLSSQFIIYYGRLNFPIVDIFGEKTENKKQTKMNNINYVNMYLRYYLRLH